MEKREKQRIDLTNMVEELRQAMQEDETTRKATYGERGLILLCEKALDVIGQL